MWDTFGLTMNAYFGALIIAYLTVKYKHLIFILLSIIGVTPSGFMTWVYLVGGGLNIKTYIYTFLI